MFPRLKVQDCARGTIHLNSASNGAVAYLYNNSTGRDLLVVRDVQFMAETLPEFMFVGSIRGHSGTGPGVIAPIITDQAPPPGQLFIDDPATPPAGDFVIPTIFAGTKPWDHDFPLAIIQPGWSFFLSAPAGTGAAIDVGFYWQRTAREDIDGTLTELALKLDRG